VGNKKLSSAVFFQVNCCNYSLNSLKIITKTYSMAHSLIIKLNSLIFEGNSTEICYCTYIRISNHACFWRKTVAIVPFSGLLISSQLHLHAYRSMCDALHIKSKVSRASVHQRAFSNCMHVAFDIWFILQISPKCHKY